MPPNPVERGSPAEVAVLSAPCGADGTWSHPDAQAKQRTRQMNDGAAGATEEVREGAESVMLALDEEDAGAYVTAAKALTDACADAGH